MVLHQESSFNTSIRNIRVHISCLCITFQLLMARLAQVVERRCDKIKCKMLLVRIPAMFWNVANLKFSQHKI